MAASFTDSGFFSLFNLDYNENDLSHISQTLKALLDDNYIYGFGIYRKYNDKDMIIEFTVVIKKIERAGHVLQMVYKRQARNIFHRTNKIATKGPKKIFEKLECNDYEINMNVPYAKRLLGSTNDILLNPILGDEDIEYNFSSERLILGYLPSSTSNTEELTDTSKKGGKYISKKKYKINYQRSKLNKFM